MRVMICLLHKNLPTQTALHNLCTHVVLQLNKTLTLYECFRQVQHYDPKAEIVMTTQSLGLFFKTLSISKAQFV